MHAAAINRLALRGHASAERAADPLQGARIDTKSLRYLAQALGALWRLFISCPGRKEQQPMDEKAIKLEARLGAIEYMVGQLFRNNTKDRVSASK